jgi:hypothetical protein
VPCDNELIPKLLNMEITVLIEKYNTREYNGVQSGRSSPWFGEAYCLHLQGSILSLPGKDKEEICS